MSTNKTGNQIETKREEFRKYLEKEGVLQSLTTVLVSLYEEPEKPADAVTYLKNCFDSGRALTEQQLKNAKEETERLRNKIQELEKQYTNIEQEFNEYKIKYPPNSVSTNTCEKGDSKEVTSSPCQSSQSITSVIETKNDEDNVDMEEDPEILSVSTLTNTEKKEEVEVVEKENEESHISLKKESSFDNDKGDSSQITEGAAVVAAVAPVETKEEEEPAAMDVEDSDVQPTDVNPLLDTQPSATSDTAKDSSVTDLEN